MTQPPSSGNCRIISYKCFSEHTSGGPGPGQTAWGGKCRGRGAFRYQWQSILGIDMETWGHDTSPDINTSNITKSLNIKVEQDQRLSQSVTCKIHFPADDLTMSGPGERHKGGVNGEIELIKELIKASRTRQARVKGQQGSDSDGKMATGNSSQLERRIKVINCPFKSIESWSRNGVLTYIEPQCVIWHQSMNNNAGAAEPAAEPAALNLDRIRGWKVGRGEVGGVRSQKDHCSNTNNWNNLSKSRKK